jgi:phosphopentomutase
MNSMNSKIMAAKFKRIVLLVLDSAGIGEMPDAAAWGDAGADTLGNILKSRKVDLRICKI